MQQALQHYFIEQCQQRIKQIATQMNEYEQQYQCNYETFKQTIQTDKDFLKKIETQNPFWEEDAMEWEYKLEEYKTWHNRLKAILQP